MINKVVDITPWDLISIHKRSTPKNLITVPIVVKQDTRYTLYHLTKEFTRGLALSVNNYSHIQLFFNKIPIYFNDVNSDDQYFLNFNNTIYYFSQESFIDGLIFGFNITNRSYKMSLLFCDNYNGVSIVT
jgi:hypothetical protein